MEKQENTDQRVTNKTPDSTVTTLGVTRDSEMYNSNAEIIAHEDTLRGSVNWFYWIAGLSLATSIMQLMGSDRAFLAGLGITQVMDSIFAEFGGSATTVAIVFDVFIAIFLVACGYFGSKKNLIAIIIGLGFYLFDTLLLIAIAIFYSVPQLILSIAFHAFVLYRLFIAFNACKELNKLETGSMVTTTPPLPPESF